MTRLAGWWARGWPHAATWAAVLLLLWCGLLIAWGTFPWWLVFPWFVATFQMGWVAGCLHERERWRSARIIFRLREVDNKGEEAPWRDGMSEN